MKTPLLLILFSFILENHALAQAESYTHFEWDVVRLGSVSPVSFDGVGNGVVVSSEPRFNYLDDFSLSLRCELAVHRLDRKTSSTQVGTAGSIAFMGDYYYNFRPKIRPFVGFGFGYFRGSRFEFDNQPPFGEGNSVVLSPRVGVELGHVRLTAEYNHTFDPVFINYFSMQLGITLFGGYRGVG
ncbi:MAG: hypothetical protein AAGA77_08900 [Bacteroidota bacterium]